MKLKAAISILALAVTATTAQAKVVIFDGNNGGTPKAGSVETATGGVAVGSDRKGATLVFSDFSVTSGYSHSINLGYKNFDITKDITLDGVVYQDLTPAHGGLGMQESSATGGVNTDSDNLEANLVTGAVGDEILFFDFDTEVVLDRVWFNGNHREKTAFNDNGSNDPGDTLFTLFYSADGVNYTRTANQSSPIDQEYMDTGIMSGYLNWAVAATGWNSAPGGYVEAIRYASVPEPASLALLGLGLAGLGLRRRK